MAFKHEKYLRLADHSDDEIDCIHEKLETNFSDEDSTTAFQLKRNVGFFSGVSIVVGSMIGSGIFILPTEVLKQLNGNVPLSMVAWTLGGVVAILVALCFCELSTLIPESGGMAPFLKLIYGDAVCFMFLWIFLLAGNPQSNAVQIIALGEYISKALKVATGICEEENLPYLSKMIGTIFVLLVLVCNIKDVKWAIKLQLWCTIGKVVALIVIAVVGMAEIFMDSTVLMSNLQNSLIPSITSNNTSVESNSHLEVSSVSLAIFQALWAYDGFDNITCMTEEIKNPKKTLPMIIITSVISVMILYLIVNLAYFGVLTESEMIASNAVAVSFAAKVHPWLSFPVTVGVCLSLIGSLNVNFLTAGRMPFVAARLGFMPEILSMVHIKHFTPLPALLFQTGLSAIMLLPSSISMLLQATVFTFWTFRTACAFGILILNHKMKEVERPYKVYRITAILATLFGAYMVLVPFLFKPQLLYGLAVFLGFVFIIIYQFLKRNYFSMKGAGRFSITCQKLFMVALPDYDLCKHD